MITSIVVSTSFSFDQGLVHEVEEDAPELRENIDCDELFGDLIEESCFDFGGYFSGHDRVHLEHSYELVHDDNFGPVDMILLHSQSNNNEGNQEKIEVEVVVSVSVDDSLSVENDCIVGYVPCIKLKDNVSDQDSGVYSIKDQHCGSGQLSLPGDCAIGEDYCHLGEVEDDGLEDQGVP